VDSKEIKELIELISRSNFSSFELEREGLKLKLVKDSPTGLRTVVESIEPVSDVMAAIAPPAQSEPVRTATADDLVELNSPIVGTFYASPGPDSPPFTEPGARVKQGQVMCIVEAMKVMNEIESEIDAEVVEIVVADGQPVEFGELLFRLRPLSRVSS
jgi:acetyl-CoA carboxylase biotin carboxyl carrier protein